MKLVNRAPYLMHQLVSKTLICINRHNDINDIAFFCFVASGEDPQCTTPKSRKHDPYSQSHLAPPSTSPHPVVMHGGSGPSGEEYEMNSPPNWPRPVAGAVSTFGFTIICLNIKLFVY